MITKEKLVLVADDEKSFRDLVGRLLPAKKYRVAGAEDGVNALRLARAERPELILLDLEMPEKNGKDVLRALRRGLQTRAIPVIVLSGSADITDKIAAFDLGADCYLTKPFDTRELAGRIEGLLNSGRRTLSADALTRLPGGPSIEQEISRRIEQGTSFSFSRIDIDDFNAFNKAYSFERGDELLLEITGILLCAMAEGGLHDDFAGHMGGDNFVAITSPERAEVLARAVTKRFDRATARFLLSGSSATEGLPAGNQTPRLSIGIVSSVRRKLGHYAKVAEISSELIRYLQNGKRAGRSVYLLDRRSDHGAAAETMTGRQVSAF